MSYASYFPINESLDVRRMQSPDVQICFNLDSIEEKNLRFESAVKMAYGLHGKEFAMIDQDIQPSLDIADRMSYWQLAALMTFGILGALLLPVAALVLY